MCVHACIRAQQCAPTRLQRGPPHLDCFDRRRLDACLLQEALERRHQLGGGSEEAQHLLLRAPWLWLPLRRVPSLRAPLQDVCSRVHTRHARARVTRELARTLVTRMRRLSAREPERREPRPRSTGRARRRGSDTRQGCSAEALQRLEHLLPCCVLRRHHCRPRMVSRRRNSCPVGGSNRWTGPKAHGGSRHLGHSIIRVGRGGWPGQP